MPEQQLIKELLLELERALSVLKKYQARSQKEIETDIGVLYAVEHAFQLAIQNMIDISMHILFELGETKVADYTTALIKLGQYEIVPQEYATKISKMAGFRNVIVHGYIQIDLNRIYDNLQNNLEDFEYFIKYLLVYIKKL